MAVIIETETPHALLKEIKKGIDDGDVVTWEYDSEGDFTHSPSQWKNKAWFEPNLEAKGFLRFGLLPPGDDKISREIYGVYHGRFIEMLLAHFYDSFTRVKATPQKHSLDKFEWEEV